MTTETTTFAESWPGRFLLAPVSGRTYLNLLYLALAFPMGLAYFVFLTVGLSLGIGLTIIWVGLPILALVFAAGWGAAKLERQMAIHLLGAAVPPMAPAAVPGRDLLDRLKAYLGNPVTWKGLAFLAIKFPLGIATFVLLVTLISVSVSLTLAPFFFTWSPPEIFLWEIDTLSEALLCSLVGLVTLLVSLNALNGVAQAWRWLSRQALGSSRFDRPTGPVGPAAPAGLLSPELLPVTA